MHPPITEKTLVPRTAAPQPLPKGHFVGGLVAELPGSLASRYAELGMGPSSSRLARAWTHPDLARDLPPPKKSFRFQLSRGRGGNVPSANIHRSCDLSIVRAVEICGVSSAPARTAHQISLTHPQFESKQKGQGNAPRSRLFRCRKGTPRAVKGRRVPPGLRVADPGGRGATIAQGPWCWKPGPPAFLAAGAAGDRRASTADPGHKKTCFFNTARQERPGAGRHPVKR